MVSMMFTAHAQTLQARACQLAPDLCSSSFMVSNCKSEAGTPVLLGTQLLLSCAEAGSFFADDYPAVAMHCCNTCVCYRLWDNQCCGAVSAACKGSDMTAAAHS